MLKKLMCVLAMAVLLGAIIGCSSSDTPPVDDSETTTDGGDSD